ncbi:MAG TPA: hypothetical protein VIJ00_13540 [Nakamurella sp.]
MTAKQTVPPAGHNRLSGALGGFPGRWPVPWLPGGALIPPRRFSRALSCPTSAFAAFMGLESTALYRPEARDPERSIPRATYAAVRPDRHENRPGPHRAHRNYSASLVGRFP